MFCLQLGYPNVYIVLNYKNHFLMGLFSGLMGHASAVDLDQLKQEFAPLLVPNENIEAGFKVIRDMFVFTNKRLILVDKQGITGSKTELLSIPYKSIEYFSKESAGILDLDSELKIWVRGMEAPVSKKFGRNDNVNAIYQILSNYVL